MVQVLGSELNEHMTFKILNPTTMFGIKETSGVIQTTGTPFDREEKDNYILVVEVTFDHPFFLSSIVCD